jgi:integrase
MTDTFIRGIQPSARRRVLTDAQTRGLELHVTPAGLKAWFLWYRTENGSSRRLRLGEYPALGLHGARQAAVKAAARVASGEDPQADRVRARRAPKDRLKPVTFGDLWITYAEQVLPQRKPRTAVYNTWLWQAHIAPTLGQIALLELDHASIRTVIRKIGADTPPTANRVLALVKAVLNFAVREELIGANPVAGLSRLFAETSRERVLRDDELTILWKALDAAPADPKVNASAATCAAIRLALLTAQRAGEVAGMHTRELDAAARTWSLPASRTKQKRAQTVPLNTRAWAILCERLGDDPAAWADRFVFPMRGDPSRPMDRHTLSRATAHIRESYNIERFTPHDLRRTCATLIASERAAIAPHIVSEVLGHAPAGPRVTQIYMRHAFDVEKRHAMDTWCALLLEIVGDTPPRPRNVTPLRPASGT